MKECNKCNEVKELTEFHKRSDSTDGYFPRCKVCRLVARKKSYLKNIDHETAYKKSYYKLNKAEILRSQNQRKKVRYRTDPAFRVTHLLRSRLHQALNGKNKSASTLDLLGCTPEHARFHIESQFTEGMTWENIHIDHIQPCASFDLEDPNEQRKCFHYTNLQPLLAEDNLRKSDSIVAEHQVKLL